MLHKKLTWNSERFTNSSVSSVKGKENCDACKVAQTKACQRGDNRKGQKALNWQQGEGNDIRSLEEWSVGKYVLYKLGDWAYRWNKKHTVVSCEYFPVSCPFSKWLSCVAAMCWHCLFVTCDPTAATEVIFFNCSLSFWTFFDIVFFPFPPLPFNFFLLVRFQCCSFATPVCLGWCPFSRFFLDHLCLLFCTLRAFFVFSPPRSLPLVLFSVSRLVWSKKLQFGKRNTDNKAKIIYENYEKFSKGIVQNLITMVCEAGHSLRRLKVWNTGGHICRYRMVSENGERINP